MNVGCIPSYWVTKKSNISGYGFNGELDIAARRATCRTGCHDQNCDVVASLCAVEYVLDDRPRRVRCSSHALIRKRDA
jgi:hypothetical protein